MLFIDKLIYDPAGDPIYPRGDSRNDNLNLTGIAGAERECWCGAPVPGERFTLNACIDEETCIDLHGADGCHPIGSELYQTVGFMGGLIHDVFDEEARVYEVWVDGVLTSAQGTDLTKYDIGQYVALAKIDTDFPLDEFGQREAVTNNNVPTVGIEEYVIIPYTFQGV